MDELCELKIPAFWLVYMASNEDGSLSATIRVTSEQSALIELFKNYHAAQPKEAQPEPKVETRLRKNGWR